MAYPVIWSSDYGPDVSDLVAHVVLHGLAREGEAEILAEVVCTSNEKSPGAMSAVDTWHGRPDIPIGAWSGTVTGGPFDGGPLFPAGGGGGESDGEAWASALYDAAEVYPRALSVGDVRSAAAVMREALAGAADGSVKLVSTGMHTTLTALLDSPGDATDPRDGAALVATKVAALHVMGGQARDFPEFNLEHAPADAAVVADRWPVPIYWHRFELGVDVRTGRWQGDEHAGHIVRFALEAFDHSPGADGRGRQSWDALCMLEAIRGHDAGFSYEQGTMTVDPATGVDTWMPDPRGRHYLVAAEWPRERYEAVLEPLVWHGRAAVARSARSH